TNRLHSALWSSDGVEVFATQRAIEALTFYFAYARGKEKALEKARVVGDRGSERQASDDSHDVVVFRNKTGRPLFFEAVGTLAEVEGPVKIGPISPLPDPWQAQDWSAYINLFDLKPIGFLPDDAEDLRKRAFAK